jgi:alkanesulfonate monooxygenase SsuD/methylene tetrahydromethanopterin reductase-like flavin-dependent oxidoreductase (luciferase family)
VAIGATVAEVEEQARPARGPVAAARRRRARRGPAGGYGGAAFGTPAQIVEQLGALREAGMTYPICYFPDAVHDPSGVELFEREVIPALT